MKLHLPFRSPIFKKWTVLLIGLSACAFLYVNETKSAISVPPAQNSRVAASTMGDKGVLQSSKNRPDAPKFIVHFGPHKTGSSTIEGVLTELDLQGILKRDNLYFMGKIDGLPMPLNESYVTYSNENYATLLKNSCLYPMSVQKLNASELSEVCLKNIDRVTNLIDIHYSKGHNVIISDELLEVLLPIFFDDSYMSGNVYAHASASDLSKVFLPILGKYWQEEHMHLMYVYRRFYEQEFSKYKERAKFILNAFTRPHEDGWGHKALVAGYHSFPHSYASIYSRRKNHNKEFDTFYYHRSLPKFFHEDQLTLMNLHQPTDFIEEFVCTSIPVSTDASCNYLKTHRDQFHNANQRNKYEIHYALIAREAHERYGESLECYSPQTLFDTIHEYHDYYLQQNINTTTTKKAADDLIEFLCLYNCLEPEIEEYLLHETIEYEKELFPEFFYHQGGEESIQENFQKNIDEHTFCSVDFDELFSNPSWETFFKNLFCDEAGTDG